MLDTKISDATLGQSMAVGGLNAGIGAVTGLAGQWVNSIFNQAQSQREYERQKEFAQNSIQWRVADAMKAGVHPLAALGGQGINYSPVVDTESDYGGAIERSGQAFQSAMDRYLQNQMFQKSKAEINLVEAQTAYYNALAQKTAQPEIVSQKPQVSTPIKSEQKFKQVDKTRPVSVNNYDEVKVNHWRQVGNIALGTHIGDKEGSLLVSSNGGKTYSLTMGEPMSDIADTNFIEWMDSVAHSLNTRFTNLEKQVSYLASQSTGVPVVAKRKWNGDYSLEVIDPVLSVPASNFMKGGAK